MSHLIPRVPKRSVALTRDHGDDSLDFSTELDNRTLTAVLGATLYCANRSATYEEFRGCLFSGPSPSPMPDQSDIPMQDQSSDVPLVDLPDAPQGNEMPIAKPPPIDGQVLFHSRGKQKRF